MIDSIKCPIIADEEIVLKLFMEIEIEEVIVREREDGIIHVHFKEGIEITVELQGRMYDIYSEICGDSKRPFMFTAAEFVTYTKEARDNALIMEGLYTGIATAVVAPTLAYKLIANFYLMVNKPKKPYKVFSDEETAIEWLKTFL